MAFEHLMCLLTANVRTKGWWGVGGGHEVGFFFFSLHVVLQVSISSNTSQDKVNHPVVSLHTHRLSVQRCRQSQRTKGDGKRSLFKNTHRVVTVTANGSQFQNVARRLTAYLRNVDILNRI